MNDEEVSLATRAAWLYYVGDHTQEQIAERLGVSRTKTHRLITLAHRMGRVKVFVEGVPAECLALEKQLIERFALRFCTVVPTLLDSEDETTLFAALGTGGARFLYRFLEKAGTAPIGLGQGRTLAAVIDRLPHFSRPGLRFVSLLGSLTRKAAAIPFDVIYRISERTGGEGHFMPVPLIADSAADAEVLLAQRSVQEVFSLARQTELCVIGIGDLEPNGFMRHMNMLKNFEIEELRTGGAVGDVLAQFLDGDGRPVNCELNHRSLSLRLEELRGREVVAIAGGTDKRRAIPAALRSGLITGLVTDEGVAQHIVADTR